MSNGLYAPNEKTEFPAKIKVIVLYYILYIYMLNVVRQ
jgi:hypothetical protein